MKHEQQAVQYEWIGETRVTIAPLRNSAAKKKRLAALSEASHNKSFVPVRDNSLGCLIFPNPNPSSTSNTSPLIRPEPIRPSSKEKMPDLEKIIDSNFPQ